MNWPRRAISTAAWPAVVVSLALVGGWACACRGGDSSGDEHPPLRFRRVHVPAERAPDWPRGGLRYLPLRGVDFERLVSDEASFATGSPSPVGARVIEAEFSARLSRNELIDGRAELAIVHDAKHAVRLPLAPCGILVRNATWRDSTGAAPLLGNDRGGNLWCVVEASGRLQWDWSLKSASGDTDSIEFLLALPNSPSTRLLLETPRERVARAADAIVTELEGGMDALRRWRIDFGGSSPLRLFVDADEGASQRERLALLQSSLTYDISTRGIELVAQLEIDVHYRPLRHLTLLLDAGLHLVEATYGPAQVPWTAEAPDAQGVTNARLELPEPILDTGRVVVVRAVGGLVRDRHWTLPSIRAPELLWREGTTVLRVAKPLSLERLETRGCGQTRTGALPAPLAGESIELECFEPQAAVDLILTRNAEPVRLRTATAVDWSRDELRATVVAEVPAAAATQSLLQARVIDPWIVERVEAVPAELLADWRVDDTEPREQTLRIRGRPGSAPEGAAKVIVYGRYIGATGASLAIDGLRMLDFGESAATHYMTMRAKEPHRLKLVDGENLKHLDVNRIDGEVAALFLEPPSGIFFLYDVASATARAALTQRETRCSADIRLEATITPRSILEQCTIRWLPEATRIRRLRVHFSTPSADVPRWVVSPKGTSSLTARKLAVEAPRHGEGAPYGETWELTWSRMLSAPFEIQCTRRFDWTKEHLVGLVAVPDATEQRGIVLIHGEGKVDFSAPYTVLKRAPSTAIPPGGMTTLRGAFQYDPRYDVDRPDALLRICRLDSLRALAAPIAWSSDLMSRVAADGTAQHRAIYHIQNDSESNFHVAIPPRSRVTGVWVDSRPISHRMDRRGLSIDLPPRQEPSRVVVEWKSHGAALGPMTSIACQPPALDIPQLYREWTLWLPPGYTTASSIAELGGGPRRSWTQRLLGPLGRAASVEPLNPLEVRRYLTDHATGTSTVRPAVDDLAGWNAVRFELGDHEVRNVRVVRIEVVTSTAVAACLMAAGLVWSGRLSRAVPIVISLCSLATMALLVAEAYAPIASGALWGIAIGLLMRRFGVGREPAEANDSSLQRKPPVAAVTAVVAVIVAACIVAGRAGGAEPPAALPSPAAAAPETIHQVLIPVDERRQPSGEWYFVPEPLYTILRRIELALVDTRSTWLIRSAEYRGVLARDANGGDIAVSRFTAAYEIHCFEPRLAITLPLSRQAASLVAPAALLDGTPVEPQWDDAGEAITVTVSESGAHKLELFLRPNINAMDVDRGFDFALPVCAAANMELLLPPGMDPSLVQVPSARGRVVRSDDGPRIAAELGPSQRLSVRWPPTVDAGSEPARFTVDELQWLKIKAGSVALDVRLRLKVTAGALSHIDLHADARLRLLPASASGDVKITATRSTIWDPRRQRLEFAPPVTNDVVVDATLILTGASGVGNIRLPRFELLDASGSRRLLAVSVEDSLEHELGQGSPLVPIRAEEFLTEWGKTGEDDSAPQSAYRLPSGASDWSMSTRRRNPSEDASPTLTVTMGRSRADVAFDSDLNTTSGFRFQHRLNVPPKFNVERIAVTADGNDKLLRWSKSWDDIITVFLSGPVTGPHRLSVRGSLPVAIDAATPLPKLDVNASEARTRVNILRRPDIVLDVVETVGLRVLANAAVDGSLAQGGRLVASYDSTDPAYGAVLRVTPNRPRFAATQLSTLSREANEWKATVDLNLTVHQGMVDLVLLNAPPEWTEPFEVHPPYSLEVVAKREEGDRLVLIRLPKSAEGQSRLVVRGAIRLAPSDTLRVPNISLVGAEMLERYVAVPTMSQQQRLNWRTRGMSLVDRDVPWPVASKLSVYRVQSDDAEALLDAVATAQGAPRVQLAEMRLAFSDDGACGGVASFDLEPMGLAHCPLWMPPGFEIVSAEVGGIRAMVEPTQDGPRIALGPELLPQHIEIAFAGRLSSHSSMWRRVAIAAPTLGNLPVERSLWTVTGPPGTVLTADGVQSLSPSEYEAERLNAAIGAPAAASSRAVSSTARANRASADPWDRFSSRLQFALHGGRRTVTVHWRYPARRDLAGRLMAAAAFVCLGTAFAGSGRCRRALASLASHTPWMVVLAGLAAWLFLNPLAGIAGLLAALASLAWICARSLARRRTVRVTVG